MPEISVIVPIYKVESCLRPCVDSILGQTFSDFELILVDDGSPDNCGSICDEYALQDARVRVIHRENGGLSAARNSGLAIATGSYISFVDSDDLIAPDCLARMMQVAQRENVKLVLCCRQDFPDGQTPLLETGIDAPDSVRVMTGKTLCMERYDPDKNILITAWGKLFHRSLWDGHEFPVGKIHEDQFVIPIIMYLAERAALLESRLYFYRLRQGSITSSFNARHFDNIEGMDIVTRFYESQQEPELVKAAKLFREKGVAQYTLAARENGITDYPAAYQMPLGKALRIVKKYYGYDYYIRKLSKIDPKRAQLSENLHKISQMFSSGRNQK